MTSLDQIKALREKTGIGMIDAKNALTESGGDIDKAILYLRKQGAFKAHKKGTRAMNEGLVHAYIHSNGKMGVLIEVTCETDFVARTDDFKNFVNDIALHVTAADPTYLSKEDVPENVIQDEAALARTQLKGQGKNDTIIEKALQGKMQEFYQENCLLDQKFIKDESFTIEELLHDVVAKLGENIKIKRFTRFSL